jgi:hypothetical protein
MSALSKVVRRFAESQFSYAGDGLATRNKNLAFTHDQRFADAYKWSAFSEFAGRGPNWTGVDIRWRAHICVWAAKQALKREGDFVECGVDTAILSGTVLKYLDFEKLPRKFWLFDTFNGVPFHPDMTAQEIAAAESMNSKCYFDSFAFVSEKVASFPSVELVRGILPDTLDAIDGRKIAYLSIDLNNATAESAVIERLWQQLSDGSVVVIDDYAFLGNEDQHEMWNAFSW